MIQGQGQLYRRPAHGCLTNTMRGPEQLFDSEDRWVTSMGAWFPGERVVFRGQDLFHDLKDLSWMALLIYGITGRVQDEKQVRLFNGIWTLCTSYPEPRLWNNRVAALAGTTRSTATLAISAANAVSEASIYGRRPDIRAIDFLLRTQEQLDRGADLEELIRAEIKKYKGIFGYGRPITPKDERIGPLMALAKELGFSEGSYLKLAFAVEEILLRGRWRLHMNIAAVAAALAADQGLSRREYYHYLVLSFSAGMFACHLDAMNKPEGTFFPLRCDRVAYAGKSRRIWEKV
jgi:citrate synthase